MTHQSSARLTAAIAAHEAGRLAEAEPVYLALLAEHRDEPPLLSRVLRQLGVLRLQRGDVEASLAATRRAIELEPDSAEAHANLATALHMKGEDDAAIGSYETALALDAERPESHYGLGSALLARSPVRALDCFARAAALDPEYVEAQCALGAACLALGRQHDALAPLARALALDPDYAEAHRGRAAALQALQRPAEARGHYERAVHLAPTHLATHLGLAAVQRALGRYEAALDCYTAALALDPASTEAQLGSAAVLEELGRVGEARRAYETLLAREPDCVRAQCALLGLAPPGAGDPRFAALEARASHEELSADERIQVHFALGKALAESGDPARGFRQLIEGNRLHRRRLAYDEPATLRMLARIPEIFTPAFLRGKSGSGDPAPLPIFIVGMPRCGSTLLEQILASVPGIFGGGERPDLNEAVRRAGLDAPRAPYPAAIPALTPAQIRQISGEYLGALRAAAPGAVRVTDKMLMNVCFVGLIHLALPAARIVHVRRDPIDTCLSCFATHFEQVPYAFDLGELGRYYRAYAAVMEHWRRVLPAGVMLEVSYERLVGDFQPEVRRVLAHCGLPWNDACLEFHKTERAVATASRSQVRKPLYRSSIGRWRPDQAQLQPLLEGLGDAL